MRKDLKLGIEVVYANESYTSIKSFYDKATFIMTYVVVK